MTTTADSTRTDGRMDREGRPCQSPVIALRAQDQVGAAVALAADATGALETVPECPPRRGTIIPRIGQLADGITPASAHDRQRSQYR